MVSLVCLLDWEGDDIGVQRRTGYLLFGHQPQDPWRPNIERAVGMVERDMNSGGC